MGNKIKNIVGRKFGRLTVTEFVELKNHKTYWRCKCDCGTTKIIMGSSLTATRNNTTSCGCARSEYLKHGRQKLHEQNTTHGGSGTREHHIWLNIKYRCDTETSTEYFRYGGRGITMCQRWRDSFENFIEDMGLAPSDKHTVDRINNDGNYEPKNCRWATRKEQANNRRGNKLITYRGRVQTATQWAEELGLKKGLVMDRLFRYGWTPERAFTTPVDVSKRAKHNKA